MQTACPVPFDEGRLWKGKDGPQLKRQLQKHFHNITRAMDCVGCEKCKLWGKLQLLGEGLLLVLLTDAMHMGQECPSVSQYAGNASSGECADSGSGCCLQKFLHPVAHESALVA